MYPCTYALNFNGSGYPEAESYNPKPFLMLLRVPDGLAASLIRTGTLGKCVLP